MHPMKLKTIAEWPFPTNLKNLQRFLGFSNFYRRFIEDFSGIAAPLTALTGKGVDIARKLEDREALNSFEKLKSLFSSKPFLIHFDFHLPRIIHVDSSGFAYSAILLQKSTDGKLHPVAYFSRKLTPTEMK